MGSSRPSITNCDVGAARAADPVLLHRDDLGRPRAAQGLEAVEQLVGVVGDLEVPLRELLLGDGGVAALAQPADDLLVREHGLVEGAPVDEARLAVREAAAVQAREDPLVPAVVLGAVRHEHAIPVERARVALHRGALLGDVRLGPARGVDAALDRRVLGGKAEAVPADGVQHVEAAHRPVAARSRRRARTPPRGPCAGRPTGTGTCRARTWWAGCRPRCPRGRAASPSTREASAPRCRGSRSGCIVGSVSLVRCRQLGWSPEDSMVGVSDAGRRWASLWSRETGAKRC